MVLSMTGFGRGIAQTQSRSIRVEIKSLNSKQLDLSMRVPSLFKELEVNMRALVADYLQRGKVELSVSLENISADSAASINTELLKSYKAQLSAMGESLGLGEPHDWYSILLRLPEAIKTDTPSLLPVEADSCMAACKEALESLVEFRKEEGRKLYFFFVDKISKIRELSNRVPDFETIRVKKIKERLEEQLGRLSSIEYDRGRLEQELIFYIEKLDITEEKTRLGAHLDYFMDTLGDENNCPEQGQGKKLGFIAQEIGREINTMGSKSNDADMQKLVVMMKDELEQIKEQLLNVL